MLSIVMLSHQLGTTVYKCGSLRIIPFIVGIHNTLQADHFRGLPPFYFAGIQDAPSQYFNIPGILTVYHAIDDRPAININRFIAFYIDYACFMDPGSEIMNFRVFFIDFIMFQEDLQKCAGRYDTR